MAIRSAVPPSIQPPHEKPTIITATAPPTAPHTAGFVHGGIVIFIARLHRFRKEKGFLLVEHLIRYFQNSPFDIAHMDRFIRACAFQGDVAASRSGVQRRRRPIGGCRDAAAGRGVEVQLQKGARPRDAALYRADRGAGDRSGLAVGVAVHANHENGFALIGRQPLEKARDVTERDDMVLSRRR
jgi:hypothetical protein